VIAPARWPGLQRAAIALLQLALVLPLVTLRDCGRSPATARTVSGLAFYTQGDGWMLGLVFGLCVGVLVALPWRGGRDARDATTLGLRAWVAAFAAIVAIFAPLMQMFSSTTPRVGWYLHGGGWTALYALYLSLSAHVCRRLPRHPQDPPVAEGWGVVAMLLVTPVAVALGTLLRLRTGRSVTVLECVAAVIVGYAFALPLALAGYGLVRARQTGAASRSLRALWWAATAVVLFGAVAATLGG